MPRRSTGGPGPLESLLSLEQRHPGLHFSEIQDRLARGDGDGWRLFVERYSRAIYTIALRLASPSGPGREETAQRVYLAVLRRLARDDYRLLREFRAESRFETYLFTAVRNEVTHVRRDDALERHQSAPLEGRTVAPLAPALAEAIGLDLERVIGELADSLAALEPRERQVLRLRFAEAVPYRELAQCFGWKDTNAAAYEVTRILRKLEPLRRCHDRLRWGEAERRVLLRCLRTWLERDPPPEAGRRRGVHDGHLRRGRQEPDG